MLKQFLAIARPCIARGQVKVALDEGAEYLSHGATGKVSSLKKYLFLYGYNMTLFKINILNIFREMIKFGLSSRIILFFQRRK